MKDIAALDQAFIQQNLSPGGCADLLSASLFLWGWENEEILHKPCEKTSP